MSRVMTYEEAVTHLSEISGPQRVQIYLGVDLSIPGQGMEDDGMFMGADEQVVVAAIQAGNWSLFWRKLER